MTMLFVVVVVVVVVEVGCRCRCCRCCLKKGRGGGTEGRRMDRGMDVCFV